MRHEVDIPSKTTIRQMFFAVKDKPMQTVLDEREKEESGAGSEEGSGWIELVPICDLRE